jgi:hypothetical protein
LWQWARGLRIDPQYNPVQSGASITKIFETLQSGILRTFDGMGER